MLSLNLKKQRFIIPALLLVFSGLSSVATAAEYEKSRLFSAAELLPAELLNSDVYQIDDKVYNDGFLNRYTVTSAWGTLEVNSDALLRIRLTELLAMTEMKKIEGADSAENALVDNAKDLGEGMVDLVEDPIGAVEGTVSGVKKMFALTGESWRSRHTRKDESAMANLGNTVSGFSKAKREFSAQFGVDPYSSNSDLQLELERIARAASGGTMIGMVAKAFIPGGLGMLVSASGISQSMNELLITSSEVELRIINREKLQKMGINADLIEQFLDDGSTSTTYKTYITGSLEAMDGVKGRGLFLNNALSAPSEDVALFRVRSAMMYAAYHADRTRLDHFIQLEESVIAVDDKNVAVVELSLDHLLWSKTLSDVIEKVDAKLQNSENVSAKQMSLSGTASEKAVAELKKRGWEVLQNERQS